MVLLFPDTPYISKISNHPPHILDKIDGTVSPSSFIPFCSFAGDWNVTGVYTDMFTVPVCNIFEETMLDGQLCYQADLDRFRNMVDKKKIATEGFVFLLDYNENRMLENGDSFLLQKNEKEAMIYVQTIGENNKLCKPQTLRKGSRLFWRFLNNLSFFIIFSGFAKIDIPFSFYRAPATLWKGRLCSY